MISLVKWLDNCLRQWLEWNMNRNTWKLEKEFTEQVSILHQVNIQWIYFYIYNFGFFVSSFYSQWQHKQPRCLVVFLWVPSAGCYDARTSFLPQTILWSQKSGLSCNIDFLAKFKNCIVQRDMRYNCVHKVKQIYFFQKPVATVCITQFSFSLLAFWYFANLETFFFFLSQGLSFQTLFTVVQQTILMNAQLSWRGQLLFPLLVSHSVP